MCTLEISAEISLRETNYIDLHSNTVPEGRNHSCVTNTWTHSVSPDITWKVKLLCRYWAVDLVDGKFRASYVLKDWECRGRHTSRRTAVGDQASLESQQNRNMYRTFGNAACYFCIHSMENEDETRATLTRVHPCSAH